MSESGRRIAGDDHRIDQRSRRFALTISLFVLRPKPGEHALEIIGRLPSDARPEEIGKPNESLFAVRFAGDRAYAVTFRQIDPLYVIDLSTPTDPRIAGALLLPGFSEFLHPVTDALLLGLGTRRIAFQARAVRYFRHRASAIARSDHTRRHVFQFTRPLRSPRIHLSRGRGCGSACCAGVRSTRELSRTRRRVHFSAATVRDPWQADPLRAHHCRRQGVVSPPARPMSRRSTARSSTATRCTTCAMGQVWGTFWSTPSQVNGPF